MLAALVVVGVVAEAEDLLVVGVVVLHRHFDLDALDLGGEVDGLGAEDGAALVEHADELADAALVVELARLARALVVQDDHQAGVEEGELPQALAEHLVIEDALAEDERIGLEVDGGAAPLGRADDVKGLGGHALGVALRMVQAAAEDLDHQGIGQRVDAGDADAVQAGGDGVGVVVELAARVQHGEDHLGRGALFGGMHLGGDAAPVVADGDRLVGVDRHLDARAVTSQGLVDRVVDHLPHELVQAGVVGRADIHAGALADGLQAFEHGDVGGAVIGVSTWGRRRARFIGGAGGGLCVSVGRGLIGGARGLGGQRGSVLGGGVGDVQSVPRLVGAARICDQSVADTGQAAFLAARFPSRSRGGSRLTGGVSEKTARAPSTADFEKQTIFRKQSDPFKTIKKTIIDTEHLPIIYTFKRPSRNQIN